MNTAPEVTDEPRGKQETKTVGLYREDIDAVERIRRHFKLENFGQAVRYAIRETVDVVERREQAA